MEQESRFPPTGFLISLNEEEQRYYWGLHSLCQTDAGSGRLSAGRVTELLKASQLSPESLHQVTEVCGARRSGFFGSAQFLVALKLLAAAQTGLPINLESANKDLPLPRFPGLQSDQDPHYAVGTQQDPRYSEGPQQDPRYGEGPQQDPRYGEGPQQDPRYGEGPQQDPRYGAGPQQDPRYGAVPQGLGASVPAELGASVEEQRASSEEGDPWRITEEQREYYTNQFRGLQPDLGALVLGTVAKNFFTKSKLPIPELSHIWELSDVDRDGALTFSEFCMAFHLIVARKNGCPLPETLPPSLQPSHPPSLPSNLLPSLPPSLQPSSLPSSLPPSLLPSLQPSSLPPSLPSSLPPSLPISLQTGFMDQDQDTPDTPPSAEPLIVFEDVDLSSKRMDRSGLDRLQPSLLKQEMTSESDQEQTEVSRSWSLLFWSNRTLSTSSNLSSLWSPPLRSYSSTSIDEAMKKAEEPPTPPPRPQKTHSRASSLDLNKLLQQGAPGVRGGWLPPPPALPPPTTDITEKTPVKKPLQTNFTRFREEDLIGPSHLRVPQKPVRRKFHPDNPEAPPSSTASLAPPTKPLQKLQSKQKREIQTTIRKNKESNAMLTRLNSELQQQLKIRVMMSILPNLSNQRYSGGQQAAAQTLPSAC
ncbi:RalBP1-associated Eps domain-containing protein 2 [Merluccius polli]|uniref:RalBP1-associated Eps domain-containing protein 2 n=1 Tax=Merluccius polli TaxID=89951 RepID=A0AA47P4M4_MERPO|nr:RalBP1-associated Eps domain-containing protein 2 [Merluccius polli]